MPSRTPSRSRSGARSSPSGRSRTAERSGTRGAGQAERRRGEALEAALLEAAWQELNEVGYARLTMEGVAARAKTGKQVLYRRWRNRAELVIAAIGHNTGTIADRIPDTGTLRGDVLALLRRMVRRRRDVSPQTLHGLLAEASTLPPEFFGIMDEVMRTVVGRAAERGECPRTGLSPRVISLPVDLLRQEILLNSGAVPDSVVIEIVDDVFLPLLAAHAGAADHDT